MWAGINRIIKDSLKGKLKAESSQFNPFIGVDIWWNWNTPIWDHISNSSGMKGKANNK